MSSKRAIRRRECKGKERYPSQKAAQAAIGRMRRNTGSTDWMSAYHCGFCGGFHFGHSPKRVRLAQGAWA
jgi:hypothetical protein